MHYNLACYWSLAHSPVKALDALETALTLEPDLRDQIADEPDFDPIRHDPDFERREAIFPMAAPGLGATVSLTWRM